MSTIQIDPSKIPSLAKAAWALVAALVMVASAIFYAGVHWENFTSTLAKGEAASERLKAYQNLEGTRPLNVAFGFPATCPPGHVVTSVTVFTGNSTVSVICAKL